MSTKMANKKPYEMSFEEFADAIKPGWSRSVLDLSKPGSSYSEWLTSVWSSKDNRTQYSTYWVNTKLKAELPPDARAYGIDDFSLHPITEKLGLDSSISEDNSKAADLLAIRNAWIAAIQHYYAQPNPDASPYTLTDAAAAEYVLLTSNWMRHPWIQQQVRQHVSDQNLIKLARAGKPERPTELSSDPNWPSAQVIHATLPELSADEQEYHRIKKESLKYWLEKFIFEDGKWTSEFDMDAYEAQREIDVANQKKHELQIIIEKQIELIHQAERTIKKFKRHEASQRASKQIGRPEKAIERQAVAIKFTSQWVQSLMDTLGIKRCTQLEILIKSSSQRNWRRWLSGQAVPTHKNLSELLNSEVTQGDYQGKPLHNVPTTPEHNDLLSLISMT